MPARPDIVWIVTTQWRAQSLGCNGDRDVHTPNIDAFAGRSINYVQAVTPHPFGPFARAALLTGIPSPTNGVIDYHDPLPRSAHTIAHELGAAGYDTAWFGKWHLAPRDTKAPLVGEVHARQEVDPEDRGGFARWEGFEGGFQLNDPWLHGDGHAGGPERVAGYQSDVLCERFVEWLEARPAPAVERPFFAVLSLEPPHPPYAAPAAGCTPPPPETLRLRGNVPLGGDAEQDARRELSGYLAHIEATDRALGRVLTHARLRGAIVVFTSVHGDMHGSHGLFRKGWPHEESLRVPLIVRLPTSLRRFQLGVDSADLVSLLDLYAWTRRWAGAAQSTPAANQPPPAPRERLVQCCSMPSVVSLPRQCDRLWSAYRTRARKLVLNADDSAWLFFDLEADPLEQNNLAANPANLPEIASFREWARRTIAPDN